MKFRAWDKTRKEFIKEDVWVYKDGEVYAGDLNNPPYVQLDKDCVQMFTGLKDKNGKEIYEGDIVEGITYDDSYISRGNVNYIDCSYKVDFREGSAVGFYYLHHIRLDTIKVIGNIYENPELLKEESS